MGRLSLAIDGCGGRRIKFDEQNVPERRLCSVGSDAGQLTVDTVEEGSGGHTLLAGWLQFLY